MTARLVLAGVVAVAGIAVGSAPAATLRVPEDYSSVLAAVDAAAERDTVLVGPGVWTERADRIVYSQGLPFLVTASAFPRHGMLLRGQGSGVTILDGGMGGAGNPELIDFTEPEGTEPLTVEGFTLRNLETAGEAAIGIVSLQSGGLVVRDCRFEEITSGGLGAVAARGCAVMLEGCEVVNCTAPDATVWLVRGSLSVRNCRFESNVGRCIQADFDGDPSPGPVRVEDCEFVGNRGVGYGVCVDLYYAPDVLVARNRFLRNTAELYPGGGLRLSVCTATVEFNVFAYDSVLVSGSLGGGVWSEGSSATLRNNTFFGCYARYGGAAFCGAFGGTVRFDKNVVAQSTGASAVFVSGTAILSNECNLYWANALGDYGTWTPSPTDFHADPLFCNGLGEDWTVQLNSPCVHAWCGPIGALGVGCDEVAIESTSWGQIKAAYRLPR